MSCSDNKVLEALGDKLLSKDGEVETKEAFKGKSVLGLYFSAHWCPPCKAFTPVLGEKYKALQAAGKDVEMVFVSSDRNEKAFDEYRAEMPFLAMQFDRRDEKNDLSELFEIEGIPTLVFVDLATGLKITDEGREAVMNPKFLETYPYRPKPFNFLQSLGDQLLTKSGTVATSDVLKNTKYLGLYFSAHWCPPCRQFTPVLAEKYKALKASHEDMEMVFVSSDRDQGQFEEYYKEMPWLAQVYSNREGKGELSKEFGVNGIPCLVVVEAQTGRVINSNARGAVNASTFVEDWPYHPKPVNSIEEPDGINADPSLVVFMEDASASEKETLTKAVTEVAEEELKLEKNERAVKRFFLATHDGEINGQIRSNTGLPSKIVPHQHPLAAQDADGSWGCDGCSKPGPKCKGRNRCAQGCDFDFCDECVEKSKGDQANRPVAMIILDLKSKGAFYSFSGSSVDKAAISKFIQDFKKGDLARRQWGE